MRAVVLVWVMARASGEFAVIGYRASSSALVPAKGAMKRLTTAPNIAIATLWADMLTAGGVAASVQRYFASGIAGEIPPDQALPEIWIADDAQLAAARLLLAELQHPPRRRWVCPACAEAIDGPFEQCWSCGATMPVADSAR
jgi:hypothetical protein